ncbi:MAG: hypothetical protein HY775_08790 [Acidobacteria bacterium]|nr:hypothetical protein [Acidobacteriota bacterium]
MRILPRRKTTWAILIGAGILGAAALLLLAQPRARAALRLVRGFSPLDVERRVWLEHGAEDMAGAIAAALPEVVARVEECQGGPFERSFRVYVCASHESFARHVGEPVSSPVRGIAFLWDVWVSPKAFSFHGRDTHREALTHELSHLHLGQKVGWWHRTKEIPSWFQEGLADWVAGTGDEQVSWREAREAILAGRSLELDESGRLPFPKRPETYGMAWPMFHMQARMFVEYLRSRDAHAFEGFVMAVVGGARFRSAFEDAFGEDLSAVWGDFVQSLEEGPG